MIVFLGFTFKDPLMQQINFPNVYTSGATGDGYVLINQGPCFLHWASADNLVGSLRFVQFFDGYTLPSNNAVPVTQLRVNTATQGILLLAPLKLLLKNGLYVASSTSSGKLTVGAPTDLSLTILWSPA